MGEITQTANDHCLILTLEYHILNLLQVAISLNNHIVEEIARDIYMNIVFWYCIYNVSENPLFMDSSRTKTVFSFWKEYIYALVDSTDEVIKALNTFINVRWKFCKGCKL